MTEPRVNTDLADLNDQIDALQTRVMPPQETPTDTGNAFRFARIFGDVVRYVPAEESWLVWDGTRLRRDDSGTVLNMTIAVCEDVQRFVALAPDAQRATWAEWARTCQSVGRRKAMLALAQTLPNLVVRAEELDADNDLLNTPSGTINLQTLELRPHNIEDKITRITRVPFNPDLTETFLLNEYMKTFMPEADKWRYLMKMLGATLRGGNDFRLWMIIYGPTTTGKSQLIESIAAAVGDYSVPVNTSVFRANQDDKPRPDMMRAIPARFVYSEESSQQWELHGDHVKKMTGGDMLTVRGMRSNIMVERVPSFTPIIVGNEFPKMRNADQGIKRRLRALHFDHSVIDRESVDKRRQFIEDQDTLTALFTQLILGCKRAYTEGVADIPADWARITMEAFDSMSHVTEFIEYMRDEGNLIEMSPHEAVANGKISQCWKMIDLHAHYKAWVTLHGDADDRRYVLNMPALGRALRSLGWETRKAAGTRWVGKLPGQYNQRADI